MEDYVRWLRKVYMEQTGVGLPDPGLIADAITILKRHSSRWPREEDFVPVVAAEMAERLKKHKSESPPFLEMLDRVADAVRHRIARAARKRMTQLTEGVLYRMAAPEKGQEAATRVLAVANELADGLSLEEQVVLARFLRGATIDQVAQELNVSVRTIYRRVSEIKRRLSENGGS